MSAMIEKCRIAANEFSRGYNPGTTHGKGNKIDFSSRQRRMNFVLFSSLRDERSLWQHSVGFTQGFTHG